MSCAKQFWKKMYTGWVMSIERLGNQGSTSPNTRCVVQYTSFCVSDCYFTKTLPNLWWFWWLQNLALHTITYMLYDQLFWSIPHLFFYNAIALPELKFIFNKISYSIALNSKSRLQSLHFLQHYTSYETSGSRQINSSLSQLQAKGTRYHGLVTFFFNLHFH